MWQQTSWDKLRYTAMSDKSYISATYDRHGHSLSRSNVNARTESNKPTNDDGPTMESEQITKSDELREERTNAKGPHGVDSFFDKAHNLIFFSSSSYGSAIATPSLSARWEYWISFLPRKGTTFVPTLTFWSSAGQNFVRCTSLLISVRPDVCSFFSIRSLYYLLIS